MRLPYSSPYIIAGLVVTLSIISAFGRGALMYYIFPHLILWTAGPLIVWQLITQKHFSITPMDIAVAGFTVFLLSISGIHQELLHPSSYNFYSIVLLYFAFRTRAADLLKTGAWEHLLLWTGGLIGLAGVYAFFFSSVERYWPFGSSAIWSYYMVVCFAATFCLHNMSANRMHIGGIALTLFFPFCILLSGSRIAILASGIILAYNFCIKERNRPLTLRWKCITVAATVSATAILAFLLKNNQESIFGRLSVYKISASIVKDHWLMGIGNAQFPVYYAQYKADYYKSGEGIARLDDAINVPYNELLHVLIAWGIPGVTVMLVILGVLIFSIKKDWRNTAAVRSRLTYFVSLFTLSITGFPFHVAILGVVAGFAIASVSDAGAKWHIKAPSYLNYFGAAALCALLLYSAVKIQALWSWQKHKAVSTGAEAYEQLAGRLSEYPVFNYLHGVALYNVGQYQRAIFKLQLSHNFHENDKILLYIGQSYENMRDSSQAVKYYKESLNAYPNRLRAAYHLFCLYRNSNDTLLARQYGKLLLNRPVKVPSGWTNVVREHAANFLHATDHVFFTPKIHTP